MVSARCVGNVWFEGGQRVAVNAGDPKPNEETPILEKRHEATWVRGGASEYGRHVVLEKRSGLSLTTGTAGGYTQAPTQTMGDAIVLAAYNVNAFDRVGITKIPYDVNFQTQRVPTMATAAEGQLLTGDTGTITIASPDQFGALDLTPHLLDSQILPVSRKIVEGPYGEISVGKLIGQRLGRIRQRLYTVGTGASQPMGAVNAATVVAGEIVQGITYGDVQNLKYACPAESRLSGSFMAHSLVIRAMSKVTDGNGQPILKTEGRRPTLDGYPLFANDNMASAFASGAKTLLFGDFSTYCVVESPQEVLRYIELFAETNCVGFEGRIYADGGLADAGLGPIRVLQH